jgi:hypothetical protein
VDRDGGGLEMSPHDDVVREAEKILSAEADKLKGEVLEDLGVEKIMLLALVELTQRLTLLVMYLDDEGHDADSDRLARAVQACADVGLNMCDRVGEAAGE